MKSKNVRVAGHGRPAAPVSLTAMERLVRRQQEALRLAGIGYWDLHHAGEELRWSAEMFVILGISAKVQKPCLKFGLNAVHPDDRAMFTRAFERSLATRREIDLTLRTVAESGETKFIRIRGRHEFDQDGTPVRSAGTAQDVTREQELTERLRNANAGLQEILDSIPARITSWNADLTNTFANRGAELKFGVPANGWAGGRYERLLGAERYERSRPHIAAALDGERREHIEIEARPDGSSIYSHIQYVPNRRNDRVVGFHALATDVTELRLSHERIRQLAQRLESIREDERRSISRLLHEGLAQDLFALKLGMDHLRGPSMGSASLRSACRELTDGIKKCMEDTRRIANDLWPSALGNLSISLAIENHAKYFGTLSGLEIHVREIAPFPELDEPQRLILFRAAQEALTNVARHAQASRVDIVLRADASTLTMEVTDDGVGIGARAKSKTGSLGLLGIRERFGALGGGLSIGRNGRSGTTFAVYMPAPNDATRLPLRASAERMSAV